MFLLTLSKNYQGNLFWHYFKNKYKRFTYLLKDVIQHRKRKLKIVPSAAHINKVISWLILNIGNCFFAVSNWESDKCAIRKNSNHIFLKQITYNSLEMLKNKLNEILWLLLDEKNKMKISFTKDSNLFICIKWTEASIRYRLFLAKYSKCHICLNFYYLVFWLNP